jgi:ABC-type lipoprotein export system ATPase subunit
MEIQLSRVMPIPLKDRFAQKKSDIWQASRLFAGNAQVKIKAPSGTGKTTLTHILYRLRSDYEGVVSYNGKDVRTIDAETLARFRQQHLAVIFQDLRLFANLTARENIELNRVLQEPFCERGAIDEMAGQLGITHILEQPARLCSYGEQQRVAIVRALVQPFSWLIMDEPFSHLDQANTRRATALIAAECARRKAGLILMDLDDDAYFPYTEQLTL